MTSRSYSGKNMSVKLDVNMDAISRNLSEQQVITLSFDKAVQETFVQEAIGKKIIADMKALIKYGGSKKYPWGYWSRTRRGDKDFKFHLGRPSKFSNSMRYSTAGTGNTIYLPVSPKTFIMRRHVRKRPRTGEFALWDTGNLLSGIYFTNTRTKYGLTYQMITNAHLRNAEYGIGMMHPRKVMLPIYEKTMMMDKSRIEANIVGKMTKDFDKLNKGL